ncbi:CvfB family protein [Alteromonas halophila]|uniref:GntR family transcriptional regulator n=1 Tax=Alteromonas halophila TaxID=516698 RepID=A0A918JM35_9ALTE|nr:hypothetical protein [Alteromonas halophila]GGW88936.1 GntR family transcriptional regulator [Alteromonas halophila]
MINVGNVNVLRVTDEYPFGFHLHTTQPDSTASEAVLLSHENAPDGLKVDDVVSMYVATNQQGDLIAWPTPPQLLVGEVGPLKAVSATHFGAFFEWGGQQDLLVPKDWQETPVNPGMQYIVHVFHDEKTNRLLGATRLHRFYSETSAYLTSGQPVDCLVYAKTELGFKVLINKQALGLLFHSDAYKPLKVGDNTSAVIKQVRDDGKIDVVLQRDDDAGRDALQQAIVEDLIAHGGLSTLTDKSKPEDIYARFDVSKGAYKKALGALYKRKVITLTDGAIRLVK